MRHGTVRIKLLITGKSTLRKRAPPTHSVAAITLGCPCSSPRFPPLPGQPVSRPARPPAAAARTPCDFLCTRGRPCARSRSGRQNALLPPARPAAARTPHSRSRAQRPPLARPAADAAHTPRCRVRAPLSAARPAAARAPLGRRHAPRPPFCPTAPQPAAHARLGGLGGGCRRAGRRRRCPPRLPLYRRRVHAAGHSGLGAGGREGVAEAGVGLQGDLALSVASARRTAQYADTRAVTRRGLRVPRRAGSERCRGGA